MADNTALQYQKQYHDSIMVHISEASEMFSQFSERRDFAFIVQPELCCCSVAACFGKPAQRKAADMNSRQAGTRTNSFFIIDLSSLTLSSQTHTAMSAVSDKLSQISI